MATIDKTVTSGVVKQLQELTKLTHEEDMSIDSVHREGVLIALSTILMNQITIGESLDGIKKELDEVEEGI